MPSECMIRIGSSTDSLVDHPIEASWILQGKPRARIELLSRSADGTASTYFWDCTAGRFRWFYSYDETVHILEGEVTLMDSAGHARRVSAGDTIFFPAGSSVEWKVDQYVRKLAFCRIPVPRYLAWARAMVRRVRRVMRGESEQETGSALL
ncbi:MAG: cupin domain-containing protein [Steroidobacteraceae bacterium]|jgi:uncharacterized cupin superfamily protein